MSNATAELTISTVNKIIAFMAKAGAVEGKIDPQEVLDHITPPSGPLPDLIISTVVSVNARQMSISPASIGENVQLYRTTDRGQSRYGLSERTQEHGEGASWVSEDGVLVEILGTYKLLGTETRPGDRFERTLLEPITAGFA